MASIDASIADDPFPFMNSFRVPTVLELPGVRSTTQRCDTLFRYATRVDQMTRVDLTAEVYQAVGMPLKESDVIVRTIFDSIVRTLLPGRKVEIRGFGSFRTRQRRGRIGRNPKTRARVEVPPKRVPFFRPSKELHELLERMWAVQRDAA